MGAAANGRRGVWLDVATASDARERDCAAVAVVAAHLPAAPGELRLEASFTDPIRACVRRGREPLSDELLKVGEGQRHGGSRLLGEVRDETVMPVPHGGSITSAALT